MTVEYAIPGEGRPPNGMDVEAARATGSVVVPWTCPGCEAVIAETRFMTFTGMAETRIIEFSPVRQVAADLDEVPFFGPSARAMRDRQERRGPQQLERAAYLREDHKRHGGDAAPNDHGGITHEVDGLVVFDTLCVNCPRRLRIRLPTA